MRIVAIADDDSLVGHLEEDKVDVLLSLGDLWDNSIEKARDRYLPSKVLGVRGNHDTDGAFPPFVTPLHFTVETFGGLVFGGFNGSWKYKNKGHHMFEQEYVSRILRAFPKVDVFIAHNSPWGIHERDSDIHQGFRGFLDYIERARPSYFIHGHQHMNLTSKHQDTEIIGVFGEQSFTINKS